VEGPLLVSQRQKKGTEHCWISFEEGKRELSSNLFCVGEGENRAFYTKNP